MTQIVKQALTAYTDVRISYSRNKDLDELQAIRTSEDAEQILRCFYDESTIDYRESFYILCLSRSNKPLAVVKMAEGGQTATIVDTKMIIKTALDVGAVAVVLSHNHPSGELEPSDADKRLTRKIKEAFTVMDMSLCDHIILTGTGYFSFCDNGMI